MNVTGSRQSVYNFLTGSYKIIHNGDSYDLPVIVIHVSPTCPKQIYSDLFRMFRTSRVKSEMYILEQYNKSQ